MATSILRGRTDLMGALAQGNIEEALTYIHSQKREVMRHDWTVLKDHVGELAATFGVPLDLTDGQGVRIVARHPRHSSWHYPISTGGGICPRRRQPMAHPELLGK